MRIIASLPLKLAALLPKHTKELVFVKSPVTIGIYFHKDVDFIVPFQVNGKVDAAARSALFNLKATGWDWLPEGLREHQGALTVWALSPYQTPEKVRTLLQHQGFTTVDKTCDAGTMEELYHRLPTKAVEMIYPPGEEPTESGYYPRCRFLWAKHNKQFTPWERDFVQSIGSQLKQGKKLSPKQRATVDKILQKYHVPVDATASLRTF